MSPGRLLAGHAQAMSAVTRPAAQVRALRRKLLVVASLSMSTTLAHASGLVPYCRFSTAQNGSIFDAAYRIDEAYKAADLVVVGAAVEGPADGRPQAFRPTLIVKGEAADDIRLVGRRCRGTACEGFAVPPGMELLLLLRRTADGTFHKVDGNGGDACPNVFEVSGGAAKIGIRKIPLPALRKFFGSGPAPIPYP